MPLACHLSEQGEEPCLETPPLGGASDPDMNRHRRVYIRAERTLSRWMGPHETLTQQEVMKKDTHLDVTRGFE